jgi:ABC-2 type transport system permease protein
MNSLVRKEQLAALTAAHFKEITREKGVLFWGIVFPILMALGLGIAFTRKADVVRRIAVIERSERTAAIPDQTSPIDALLRDRAKRVEAAGKKPAHYEVTIRDEKLGNTTFIFEKTSWENAMVLLKRASISVAIDEDDGGVRYHFDPRNPDAQLTYLKLSRLIGGETIVVTSPTRGTPPHTQDTPSSPGDSIPATMGSTHDTPTREGEVEPLTVAGTRYIDFLVPGLMAMGVMMSCLWGMSWGVVEKRSKKLLRRMIATPMRKSHFLVAMMTVRIGMNFVESALLFVFAHLVFNITIQGDVSALFAIFIAGNIAFAGMAIFVSARTANTEVANGIINAVSLPMLILSGVFFSYHNFPEWSIPFIQKMPMTMLADGMRSIFIEGGGYGAIYLPALVLTAIGVVFFAAGLKVFRWY